ncbi:hypothetical protein GOBAR_AA32759 [Gossypium barbadense]|uniref:GDSL esterase/lipase n=1 Tax=Gossypium barbadense TaxID=3634 RepID=A0A2P5WA59_GOSBA|nr:hypothetical protein GOBAR_AA32759 [Gossypium barbadense]
MYLTPNVYGLGVRKIGITSLPPLGCIPLARTLFGYHEKGCVSRFNTDAQQFNKKLNAATTNLQKQHSDLKIVVFDIYKALLDVVNTPSNYQYGSFLIDAFTRFIQFLDATSGCCGIGTVETTIFMCNPYTLGTCPNASKYVFWDSVHPSQAANQVLADALITEGIELIG